MLEAALIGARLLHYASLTVLFGAALFPFYAFPWREPAPTAVMSAVKRLLLAAAATALISGVLWFAATAAVMSGSLSDGLSRDVLVTVLLDTPFGHLWAVRLAVFVVAVAPGIVWLDSSGRGWWMTAGAAVLLASLALTGHAQTHEGDVGRLHEAADALHLLAAGTWLGGLAGLGLMGAHRDGETAAARALARFSGAGYAAVAVLLATGVANSAALLSGPADLVATAYGRLLALKIGLFLVMLALAGVNRLVLVPGLARDEARAQAMVRLRRHVAAEQVLGLAVLLSVAVLGTLDPGA